MTTGNDDQSTPEANGGHPNVSPELQDAIRSIDAIGENAWGKDDDEDAPRQGEPDSPEGNPDAP